MLNETVYNKAKTEFFNKSKSIDSLCSCTEFRNFCIKNNITDDDEIANAYNSISHYYKSHPKFFETETNFRNGDFGKNISNVSNSLRHLIEDSDFIWTDLSTEDKQILLDDCLSEWGIKSEKEKSYISEYLLENFKFIPTTKVGGKPIGEFYKNLSKICHKKGYTIYVPTQVLREIVAEMNVEWNDKFLNFDLYFYSKPIAHAMLDEKLDELNNDENKALLACKYNPILGAYYSNGKFENCSDVFKQIGDMTKIFERLDQNSKDEIYQTHIYHKYSLPNSSYKESAYSDEQRSLGLHNSAHKRMVSAFIEFVVNSKLDVNKITDNKISNREWKKLLESLDYKKSNVSKKISQYKSCYEWYKSCYDVILEMKEFVKDNMKFAQKKSESADKYGTETCHSFDTIRETIANWDNLFIGESITNNLKKMSDKKLKSESARLLVEKILNNIEEHIEFEKAVPYKGIFKIKNQSLIKYIELLNDPIFDNFENQYPLWFSYKKSKIFSLYR